VTARVLLASGDTDPVVPVEQNARYAAALRAAQPNAYVDEAVLPWGTERFVHTLVSTESLADLAQRADALVAPVAT
jgi:hypothetical protein